MTKMWSTHKLVKGDLGTTRVEHEPPGVAKDRRATDIDSNDHVTEEKPLADKRFTAVPGRYTHNGMVGRIEAESGGRQTVRNEIDPQELDRNQSLRHAQKDCKEDTDDFSDVG